MEMGKKYGFFSLRNLPAEAPRQGIERFGEDALTRHRMPLCPGNNSTLYVLCSGYNSCKFVLTYYFWKFSFFLKIWYF